MPADGEIVIESDIPCAKCGYNLRTLGREGRCPECGEEIWPSIEKFNTINERWPPLTAETAVGLARRVEGCFLCIIAIVMNQVFWFAASSSLYWNDPKWMLKYCSATLVILCWGMLKLARPSEETQRRFGVTSLCVITALLLPAVAVYVEDSQRRFDGFLQQALWLAWLWAHLVAFISLPLSLICIARWLRRAHRPVLAVLPWICIASHCLAFVAVWTELRGGYLRSSLELLVELPVPLIGMPIEAFFLPRLLAGPGHSEMWAVLPANVAQLLVGVLLLVLTIEFGKARRAICLSLQDRNASER